MSTKFKERANEVVKAGEAARGDFEPEGAPLRVYQYWHKHVKSSKRPERENFCHFWRVVMFWSPLMFARRGLMRVLEHPVTIAALVIAAVAAVAAASIMIQDVAIIVGASLGFAYLASGLFFGGVLGEEVAKNTLDGGKLLPALAALTFPTALPAFGLVYAGIKHTRVFQNTIFGILLTAAVGLLGTGLVLATMDLGWILWAWLGGVAAFAGLCFLGIQRVADVVKGKRIIAEREARAKKEALWVKEMDYFAEHGEWPEWGKVVANRPAARPSKPSKAAVFFKSVGDFIILLAQIVRVNKWKICPTVTIPKD